MSLVPSVTETLLAWGVEPVAVTRFCEQPGYPTVGGTKNPDIDGIVALEPDLVVVDREENRRPDAEAIEAAGVRLHVTHVRSVADVAPTLAGLRRALGLPEEETGGNGAAGSERAGAGRPARRVFVPIWRRPWISISSATYGSSILRLAGADNVLDDLADPYPEVTLEQVAARRPEVVLAPSEPYPFGPRHAGLFDGLAPMVPVDGKDLFWWGVRTAGAVGRLEAVVAGLA